MNTVVSECGFIPRKRTQKEVRGEKFPPEVNQPPAEAKRFPR